MWDFPGGSVVKTSPSIASHVGSIPGQEAGVQSLVMEGRSHMPHGQETKA